MKNDLGTDPKTLQGPLKSLSNSVFTKSITNPTSNSDFYIYGWVSALNYLYRFAPTAESYKKFSTEVGISCLMKEMMEGNASVIDDGMELTIKKCDAILQQIEDKNVKKEK